MRFNGSDVTLVLDKSHDCHDRTPDSSGNRVTYLEARQKLVDISDVIRSCGVELVGPWT